MLPATCLLSFSGLPSLSAYFLLLLSFSFCLSSVNLIFLVIVCLLYVYSPFSVYLLLCQFSLLSSSLSSCLPIYRLLSRSIFLSIYLVHLQLTTLSFFLSLSLSPFLLIPCLPLLLSNYSSPLSPILLSVSHSLSLLPFPSS